MSGERYADRPGVFDAPPLQRPVEHRGDRCVAGGEDRVNPTVDSAGRAWSPDSRAGLEQVKRAVSRSGEDALAGRRRHSGGGEDSR